MGQFSPQYADLLILDEMLPLNFSPFRTVEYGHYLRFFNAVLLSLESWRVYVGNETFAEALAALPVDPSVKPRILRFNDGHGVTGRLAYVTFLGNAMTLLPYFTERSLPFILQLYPGGAFDLEQAETDETLRRVLLSPLCRKIIVTETVSQHYLVDRIGCDPEKVEFIYGTVHESRIDFDFLKDKVLYGRDKETLDLCFVANRYGTNLAAKGYDHFVTVARALAAEDQRLRFHVVGDYTAEDLPLGDAAERFTFHGRRPIDFFRSFYSRMDAIISVNRPFAAAPGAFDSFPTGSCVEAGFHGVLNCINDPLGLNVAFSDRQDIALLDDEPEHTIALLRELLAAPRSLYDLAYAGWRKFHDVFDVDKQLWARTRIIAAELARPEALIVRPRPRPSNLDGITDNVLSYWRDQVRSHQDALKDTERRHAALIEMYRDSVARNAAPWADSQRDGRASEFLPPARRTLRTRFANLRARIRRRLP